MTNKHNITRRALLAGAGATVSSAALSAAAVSVLPTMALEAQATVMTDLVTAHRSAYDAMSLLAAEYEALSELNPRPKVEVVTGVDHYTKEPCRWVHTEAQVDQEAELRRGWAFPNDKVAERLNAWSAKKKAELAVIRDERDRIAQACGLDALYERLSAAEDAEFDALKAFMTAIPTTLADVRIKAGYLADMNARDSGVVEGWIDELIQSLAVA
ncbi:hypothetical protein [uncultured Devosia sp.]|uniref:hypothetical protein n=1 Tax=uncultured Devosia sp. TaxID=211434 RepID=UPI0035CA3530